MKKIVIAAVLGAIAIAASAFAADAPKTTTAPAAGTTTTTMKPADATAKPAMDMAAMMPPKPGDETKKLAVLAGNWTSTGDMKEGAMMPGSPAQKTSGHEKCSWTADKLWLMCQADSTAGTGKTAMKWAGTYYIGWDFAQKGYRSVMVDNMGMSGMMVGTLEGTKLTLDAPPGVEMDMNGHKMKMRLSWDWADAKAVKFTMEQQIDGGAWTVSEEATMKKAGGGGA